MADASLRSSEPPPLGDGEVHLWRLPLDPPQWLLASLHDHLAPNERSAAERYVFQRDRNHFIAARGYLRAILASYAGCDPKDVRFDYGPHGKPRLTRSSAAAGLTFNLSHTRGLALCAVARGRELGVDIEQIRPAVDILGIARSTFSSGEQTSLAKLPTAQRLTAFYDCWTRKEAYIKARGDGLSYPLDAFDVSLAPNEPAALLRSAEGSTEQRRWAFFAIDAGLGYAAALVVERPVTHLYLQAWP